MIPFLLPNQLPIHSQRADNHNTFVLGTGVFKLHINKVGNLHYI